LVFTAKHELGFRVNYKNATEQLSLLSYSTYFKYSQCENRCKNRKPTLKSRWAHSSSEISHSYLQSTQL